VIRPYGEAALLVDVPSARHARSLARSLHADPPPGVVAAVAGLASVLVELDPSKRIAREVADALEERRASVAPDVAEGTLHVIEVVYDGPDLRAVAEHAGLSVEDVARLHASAELEVLFCGFAPGFAYLGDLPEALHTDRLATPRTHTPAGSVAIAGRMSGIYPADLPGGWPVIGRTDRALFDPRRDPPALLQPGDRVRFEAVLPARAG
jgi:KipI family sensor histidine kinase inhibitor